MLRKAKGDFFGIRRILPLCKKLGLYPWE
uniref:Uncharacterized protein n=1 Tax=Arundo donax TaxID=35708 RepID=A0A0A9BK48_ARUDO